MLWLPACGGKQTNNPHIKTADQLGGWKGRSYPFLCTKEIPKQQARQGLLFLVLRDRMKATNLNLARYIMEYKLLEKQDVELMKYFVDDDNTKYDEVILNTFLEEKNTFGYIAKENDIIVGFAFGYVLVKPNGIKDFYLHAIDILEEYQNHGYGTELVKYINSHSKSIGCRKMFLITNKSNISACRCYEKAGGINTTNDEIVYAYK